MRGKETETERDRDRDGDGDGDRDDEAVGAIQQHAAAFPVVLQEHQLHERHSRCRVLKQNDVECSSTQRLNLQRAAALPVALHERLNSSTQRLNLPALAHQWRPREELQVVVVVALLPSSPSERVWLAAAGLSEACGSAPARSNALESDCQKRNTH